MTRQMHYTVNRFISGLLILIMTIGPVQIAFAIDYEQIRPADNCRISMNHAAEYGIGNSDEITMIDYCLNCSVCVAHYNCAPLLPSVLSQLTARVYVHPADPTGDTVVSTRYPGLFKRPPKV